MYACKLMYESICNAPLLQPKQSRMRDRRPNRKDVSDFSLLQKNVNVNVGSPVEHNAKTDEQARTLFVTSLLN